MPRSKRGLPTSVETKNDVDARVEGECAYNAKRICSQTEMSDNVSLEKEKCDSVENQKNNVKKFDAPCIDKYDTESKNPLRKKESKNVVIVDDDDDLEESLFGISRSKEKEYQDSKVQSELLEKEDEKKPDNGTSSLEIVVAHKRKNGSNNVVDLARDDQCSDENLDSLFRPFDESKKSKSNTEHQTSEGHVNRSTNEKVDMAKKKLSKWAARLFDPNRPRGLIETPKIIPLNDEFLTEFGKREKTFHERIGESLTIDNEKINSIEIDEDEEESSDRKEPNNVCKVKISNLAYATSLATLTKKVQEFGVVEEVNLMMDENGKKQNNMPLSIGRAYVTFSSSDEASKCIDLLNDTTLEGRILRVFRAHERKTRGKGIEKNHLSLNRYWENDITSKCFRCGEVGHLRDQCQNAEIQRPCMLCSQVGHEIWKCPVGTHCFNCGVPGHVSRECPYGRSLPNRVVCGMCFTSGHHRWQCKISLEDIPVPDAICINCGKLGHFSCRDMKWSFGLNGIYCYNCGMKGHHGSDCNRPNVDICLKNQAIAMKEIERSKNWTEINDLANRELDKAFYTNGHNQSQNRGRSSRIDNDMNRPRPKSQPPYNRVNRQHGFSRNNTSRKRGYTPSRSIPPPPPLPPPPPPPPPPPSQGQRRGYRHNHFQNPYTGRRGYT